MLYLWSSEQLLFCESFSWTSVYIQAFVRKEWGRWKVFNVASRCPKVYWPVTFWVVCFSLLCVHVLQSIAVTFESCVHAYKLLNVFLLSYYNLYTWHNTWYGWSLLKSCLLSFLVCDDLKRLLWWCMRPVRSQRKLANFREQSQWGHFFLNSTYYIDYYCVLFDNHVGNCL